MTRRVVLVGALAAGMLALGGQGATANVMWCLSDPPIPLVTPGGHSLTVNNMVYISLTDRHLARLITDDATAAADGHGGTLITVHVYIPAKVRGAFVVSSNHRYKVQDSGGTGKGDRVVTLTLDVPTS